MQLVRITAPDPILTVAEVKRHLNVEHDEHNALLDFLMGAVIDDLDGPDSFMGRALGPQTWDMTLEAGELWVGGQPRSATEKLQLPLPPLIAVEEAEYRNTSGDLTAWTGFEAVGAGAEGHGFLLPSLNGAWPTVADCGDALRVRFQCGYAVNNGDSPDVSVEAVPLSFKAAALLEIGALYANRESLVIGQTVALTGTAERLLRRKRVHLGMA